MLRLIGPSSTASFPCRTTARESKPRVTSCLLLTTRCGLSLARPAQEDLSFFFTEELQNDDTPETVFLQKNDEIIVRKRRKPAPPVPVCPDFAYFKQMRSLLDDNEHKDVSFIVGPCRDVVRAHKAVLVARGDYFKGLFRVGSMRESETNEMVMEKHTVPTLERMLEYIYTNRVVSILRAFRRGTKWGRGRERLFPTRLFNRGAAHTPRPATRFPL